MTRGHSENIPDVAVRYLVFYGPNDDRTGIKGIRADAPKVAIDAYVQWYRDNNRYENGRLRPKSIVMETLLVDV